jgi:hypothetical protein
MNHTTSGRFVSSWFNIPSIIPFMILPSLWGGCALRTTLDGKLIQRHGSDGTSVLGVVTYILLRDEMEKGVTDTESKIPPICQE